MSVRSRRPDAWLLWVGSVLPLAAFFVGVSAGTNDSTGSRMLLLFLVVCGTAGSLMWFSRSYQLVPKEVAN